MRQDSSTALCAPIEQGDLNGLKQLLGREALGVRARPYGKSLAVHAALANQAKILRYLIQQGVDLSDADDEHGLTPLHAAAMVHSSECVNTLLDAGVEINARDKYGNIALFRALHSYRDDPTVVKTLLAAGSDPSIENHYGMSPVKLIEEYQVPELTDLLRGTHRNSV